MEFDPLLVVNPLDYSDDICSQLSMLECMSRLFRKNIGKLKGRNLLQFIELGYIVLDGAKQINLFYSGICKNQIISSIQCESIRWAMTVKNITTDKEFELVRDFFHTLRWICECTHK